MCYAHRLALQRTLDIKIFSVSTDFMSGTTNFPYIQENGQFARFVLRALH